MNLNKYLKGQSYDLIDGPIRNHKPLQLWLKTPADKADLYYEHISHAFVSSIALNPIEANSLDINYSKKNDYKFNIGITVLEELLKSLGMGNLGITAKITGGKKVSISYDNAKTIEYATGEFTNYLSDADFKHSNPSLLENANKDNILLISGVLVAKNLVVDIETDFDLSGEVVASLNAVAEGKIEFSASGSTKLKMVSQGTGYFPIAVKTHRLMFNKGQFENVKLISDNRDIF